MRRAAASRCAGARGPPPVDAGQLLLAAREAVHQLLLGLLVLAPALVTALPVVVTDPLLIHLVELPH